MNYARVNQTPGWTRLDVYLNGVKLDWVIAVDADANWVERYVLSERGMPLLKREGHGTTAVTERIANLKGLELRRRI